MSAGEAAPSIGSRRGAPVVDKRMGLEEAVGTIEDGMTVVLGGAGLSRKPMAMVEALALSDVRDLRLVTWVGGPDVDVLLAAGKVEELVYGYVGFDAFGMAPSFRAARQAGALKVREWSEYLVMAALEAGARRLPFMPAKSGLGTDVLRADPGLRTMRAPYTDELLVAVPAIRPDVALLHVNEGDRLGHLRILGEPHLDPLAARAAARTYATAERVLDSSDDGGDRMTTRIVAPWITGVVEAPGGAGFTSCFPEYPIDVSAVRSYLAGAGAARRG